MMKTLPKPSGLEIAVVAYEVGILLLTAYSFAQRPSNPILDAFSRDLGFPVTPRFFAALAAVCVFTSIAVLRAKSIDMRRYLYITSVSPIILYVLPVGWYLLSTGMSGFGIIIYISFYLSFVLLALATWRADDDAPAKRNAA